MTFNINGQPAEALEAYSAAAKILGQASLPLIAGLGTDIAGARAALKLAQKAGGIIDHMESRSVIPEMRLLSYTGGFYTTLGEARNRADTIVIIGKTPLERQPDLLKHLFEKAVRLPNPGGEDRSLVTIGASPAGPTVGVPTNHVTAGHLGIETLLACLSAHIAEGTVSQDKGAAGTAAELKSVTEKLKASKFVAFFYAPDEISEPAIHCLRDLINNLNRDIRAAAVTVPGGNNIVGINQVCGWTSGFPVRTSFATGHPEYDPHLYETDRLLKSGETDALIWINTLSDQPPPVTDNDLPLIVIARPGISPTSPPAVLIEAGTPGKDHDGALYNSAFNAIVTASSTDNADKKLPATAEVLNAITEQLSQIPPSDGQTAEVA